MPQLRKTQQTCAWFLYLNDIRSSGFSEQDHNPIDLLPSRDGQTLKNWLLEYNDVKIITWDRASSYASAINEACPNAVQIADRFHLLMNLSDALDTYFQSISSKIRTLITSKTNEFLELPYHEPNSDINAEDIKTELFLIVIWIKGINTGDGDK